jgi:hypothetical protein
MAFCSGTFEGLDGIGGCRRMEAGISNGRGALIVIDELLTDELAARVFGWRLAPGRYIKAGRSWIPRSRFQPLADLKDAFRLLDAASKDYCLLAKPDGFFTAEIKMGGRIGKASGKSPSRTITFAVALALGIDAPNEVALPTSVRSRSRKEASGRKNDGV